jgi:hypothetical protein
MGLSGVSAPGNPEVSEDQKMTTPSAELYREIPLTQGQVAIVDAEDYARLSLHKWFAAWDPGTLSFRAGRNAPRVNGRQKPIYMHRAVLCVENHDKRHVDHRNHNTLDNRKQNLRIASSSENQCNRAKQKNNTTGYKGVQVRGKRFTAFIGARGERHYLGCFSTATEAYCAYCTAASRLHGEFSGVL